MVSPANTNPGLTKHWDPGEPQKYYPTGVRNYARVVATDDFQGPADAMWSKSLGYKKVYVLNDKQTYGFGVATTYKNAAKKLGIKVVGFKGWDAKQSSYESLANLDQGVGCAGRLPRRHRLQQRREADAGPQGRRSEGPAADA